MHHADCRSANQHVGQLLRVRRKKEEQGDYTQLKIEVDDLWSSSDNAAHIAELMLVVPPDFKRYKAVAMDGLVAGGGPGCGLPALTH